MKRIRGILQRGFETLMQVANYLLAAGRRNKNGYDGFGDF
jgi:hypothetical protein